MLGDTLAAALPRLRAQAESMMRDTCRITRGTTVDTDPDTGAVTESPNVVYEGRCKVQTWEGYESTQEAGTASLTSQRYQVHIPVAKTADDYKPKRGDDVEILAAELDPHLAGETFNVAALLHKTLATAYRLGVTEGP